MKARRKGRVKKQFDAAIGRHLALLILLLVLIILSPFVLTFRFGVLLLNIVGVAILLAGTYAVRAQRKLFITTAIFAVTSVILSWSIAIVPAQWAIISGHVCLLAVLGLFSIHILMDVVSPGRITADKIYGAICVYLLIGYAWAFGYAIIEEVQPGSFSGAISVDADYRTVVMQMRYFSFITLTTLGFGDVVPRTPVARTFAILEAVVGQMYLAVLVARLVGQHIVDVKESDSSGEK